MSDYVDPTYNAIIPEFPFEQSFEVEAGLVPLTADLRIDFRDPSRANQAPILRHTLTRESETLFAIALSAAQTQLFRVGFVHGDLIIVDGGVSTHFKVRLEIEVVKSLTSPDLPL